MTELTEDESIAWAGNNDLFKMLVPVDDLMNDPENLNVHNERSIGAIAASLARFGQAKPIVAVKTEEGGMVVAGNGTLLAAKENGWSHIAVSFFEDIKAARAYAIADNRTAELASWDEKELAKTLDALSNDGFDMESLGFSMDEAMDIIGSITDEIVQPVEHIAGEQRNNENSANSTTGSQVVGEESHVRMIQLFLDEQTHPIFMERIRAMAVRFGADNVSEAVFAVVEWAAENIEDD